MVGLGSFHVLSVIAVEEIFRAKQGGSENNSASKNQQC